MLVCDLAAGSSGQGNGLLAATTGSPCGWQSRDDMRGAATGTVGCGSRCYRARRHSRSPRPARRCCIRRLCRALLQFRGSPGARVPWIWQRGDVCEYDGRPAPSPGPYRLSGVKRQLFYYLAPTPAGLTICLRSCSCSSVRTRSLQLHCVVHGRPPASPSPLYLFTECWLDRSRHDT